MRRHLEQLQAVATSGVEGNFIRTAPQWHEPSCICVLREGRVLMMPSNNNYAAWVYGSLQRNAARFCSTERLQTQILCGGMSACGRTATVASDGRGWPRGLNLGLLRDLQS